MTKPDVPVLEAIRARQKARDDNPIPAHKWPVEDLIHHLFEAHEDCATLLSLLSATAEDVQTTPEEPAVMDRDALETELAEAQKALRDAEARGWNDGIAHAAIACDVVADSHAYSAAPIIAGKHDGARECARDVRALKSPRTSAADVPEFVNVKFGEVEFADKSEALQEGVTALAGDGIGVKAPCCDAYRTAPCGLREACCLVTSGLMALAPAPAESVAASGRSEGRAGGADERP